MKSLGISHDNAHCNGEGCAIKDKCVRYLLHLEAIELKMEYVSYMQFQPELGKRCSGFATKKPRWY